MPRLHPGRAPARLRHDRTTSKEEVGWCLACYDDGAFTLALGPDQAGCAVHARGTSERIQSATPVSPRSTRPPRGRAGREPAMPSGLPTRPGSRRAAAPHVTRRRTPRTAARTAARALVHGRRRAAVRLAAGRYEPHPGWRNFIEPGWRVLVDQQEALQVVEELVDAQEWRSDKRASWLQILRRLVCAMDWSTGLVTALTAEALGDAGSRAPRTVSRVLAWAREVGLVVVVEHGASAEFLGTEQGRTPTYALVTSRPPAPRDAVDQEFTCSSPNTVDTLGDLPSTSVEIKPLNGGRLEPSGAVRPSWPVFGVPDSPTDRNLATQSLLERLGLDRGGVSRVPLWRARALLRPWWDAGACVAGLLFALERHPDRPDHRRGDLVRGARDPLRVIGHRLKPWQGRLGELPPTLTGIRGDYRRAQPDVDGSVAPRRPPAPADVRSRARAAVEAHLRLLRERRSR